MRHWMSLTTLLSSILILFPFLLSLPLLYHLYLFIPSGSGIFIPFSSSLFLSLSLLLSLARFSFQQTAYVADRSCSRSIRLWHPRHKHSIAGMELFVEWLSKWATGQKIYLLAAFLQLNFCDFVTSFILFFLYTLISFFFFPQLFYFSSHFS